MRTIESSDLAKSAGAGRFDPGIMSVLVSLFLLCFFLPRSSGAEVLQFATSRIDTTEASPTVSIPVTRLGTNTAATGSVAYRIDLGTASADDIDSSTRRVVFAAGVASAFINVPIVHDGKIEPTEWFRVTLMEPSEGFTLGLRTTAVVYISDNDATPAAQADSFTESNSQADIWVYTGNDGPEPMDVEVSIAGGTATAGEDYLPLPTQYLHFDPGMRFLRLPYGLTLLDDAKFEGDETIKVSVISRELRSTNTTTLVLKDNDHGASCITSRLAEFGEARQELWISRNDDGVAPKTVAVRITGGTATAHVDFEAPDQQKVALPPGRISVALPIEIFDEGTPEAEEKFQVTVIDPEAGSTNSTEVTIEDADGEVIVDPRFVADLPPAIPISITVRANGKMIVHSVNSIEAPQTTNFITQLNQDGSRDLTFRAPPILGSVRANVLDHSDRLYIGGEFSRFGDVSVPGLVRLLADGSVDLNFAPELEAAFITNVCAIAPASNGVFIAATNGAGTEIRLARLLESGARDPGFNAPVLTNADTSKFLPPVAGLEALDSGKLLVGGAFRVGKPNAVGLARIDADGSIDSTYQLPVLQGGIGRVKRTEDGRILVAPFGRFFIANNQRVGFLVLDSKGEINSVSPTGGFLGGQIAVFGTNWVWASFDANLNDYRCAVELLPQRTNSGAVSEVSFHDGFVIPAMVALDERSVVFSRILGDSGKVAKLLTNSVGFRGVRFATNSYRVREGQTVAASIERLGSNMDTLEVVCRTETVSAAERADYTPFSTNIVFQPGERTKRVQLTALKDDLIEAEEVVNIRAEWTDDAGKQRTIVPVTIIDENGAPEILSFRFQGGYRVIRSTAIPGFAYSVSETVLGYGNFPVTLPLVATNSTIEFAVPGNGNSYEFYQVYRR